MLKKKTVKIKFILMRLNIIRQKQFVYKKIYIKLIF